MGKYIIDIDEKNICSDDNGSQLAISVKVNDASAIFCTEIPLTPYTEPDLEQVRKEAYEQGLSDAWDAARTLWNTPNRKEIFGHTTFNTVLTTLTAQETIEKIRQYEQEQEEQIQVGDEVINQNKTAVVTEITNRYTRIMYSDGSGYALFAKGLTKTGRHFPEIAAVLEKMKES